MSHDHVFLHFFFLAQRSFHSRFVKHVIEQFAGGYLKFNVRPFPDPKNILPTAAPAHRKARCVAMWFVMSVTIIISSYKPQQPRCHLCSACGGERQSFKKGKEFSDVPSCTINVCFSSRSKTCFVMLGWLTFSCVQWSLSLASAAISHLQNVFVFWNLARTWKTQQQREKNMFNWK